MKLSVPRGRLVPPVPPPWRQAAEWREDKQGSYSLLAESVEAPRRIELRCLVPFNKAPFKAQTQFVCLHFLAKCKTLNCLVLTCFLLSSFSLRFIRFHPDEHSVHSIIEWSCWASSKDASDVVGKLRFLIQEEGFHRSIRIPFFSSKQKTVHQKRCSYDTPVALSMGRFRSSRALVRGGARFPRAAHPGNVH